MLKAISVFFLIISFNSFAIDECGDSLDDKVYPSLKWSEVTNYRINSTYADVNGLLCVGSSLDGKMSRFHYRDDQGVKILKTLKQMMAKDVAFFKQSDFPFAARLVTRSINPLTVRILKVNQVNGSEEAVVSVKFLRNVAKSFQAAQIKEIKIKYSLGENQTSYDGLRFNRMYLNIRGALIVKQIKLLQDSSLEKSIMTSTLKSVRRNY